MRKYFDSKLYVKKTGYFIVQAKTPQIFGNKFMLKELQIMGLINSANSRPTVVLT